MMKSTKGYGRWYFLLTTVILYGIVCLISKDQFVLVSNFFVKLLKQIVPVLFLVYLFMLLVNYFVNKKVLKKYMGEESGLKGWFIAIAVGILSVGPVYVWYPLMKQLQDKGIKSRYLVAFLYNRGIKLQWLPVLILYFGLTYTITLLIVMAIFSIPQGLITEKFIGH